MTPLAAQAVLHFWFGERDEPRAEWFRKDASFDESIRRRFGALVAVAIRSGLAGELADWRSTIEGCLAGVLLLDQFTRNIHRGTPLAFAGDRHALAIARSMVDAADDRQLPSLGRYFVYLPFEHHEDRATQDESVRLFATLAAQSSPHTEALASALDYAQRHRAIVERFGRFPHRNAILGRESTPQERAFLAQPGSSF